MTFKTDWEKTSATHQLSDEVIEEMINSSLRGALLRGNLGTKRSAHPSLLCYDTIRDDVYLLPGGCANLNYLVELDQKYILRVYLRDPEAAYREQKLGELLKDEIPLPQTLFIGEHAGYTFALTTYLEGISLAELLLSDKTHDVEQLMQDVGKILSKINAHTFEHSGFLDAALKPKTTLTAADYLNHAEQCLTTQNTLSPEALRDYLSSNIDFFPNQNEARLVHGDFDPANILVKQTDNIWKVSGILDWEFAFSGSPLHDLANMLRYAHEMPEDFETGFLSEAPLPENWRNSINLLNLVALLDCLVCTDPKTQPQKCADIKTLVKKLTSNGL